MLSVAILLLAADSSPIAIKGGPDPRAIEVSVAISALAKEVPEGKLTQDQGERLLRLMLLDSAGREGPAMLGRYERRADRIVFVPRHALTHGQVYRAAAVVNGKTVTLDHRVPARTPTPVPVVGKLYPTSDVLPANQLKFYLHFSQPMRETRRIFDLIHIIDDKGKEMFDPWRRTELWDADSKRLTLWIHPGRVKQGIGPREAEGPVLEPNRTYTLVIDAELSDAEGQPLGKPFKKTFRTTAEDRARPLPERWDVTPPPAGTRQPLVVSFGESLDRPLLDRFIEVHDEDGALAGSIEVGEHEKTWRFIPEEPWKNQEYRLRVDARLEDLAGNTPDRLFDTDLDQPAPAAPKLERVFKPKVK